MEKNVLIKILSNLIFICIFIYVVNYIFLTYSYVDEDEIFRDGFSINETDFDFIFFGDSMLNWNVNRSLFELELNNLSGMSYSPLYIMYGGDGIPYYYLVIKNKILPSNKKNIPIIIIGYGNQSLITAPSNPRGAHTLSMMAGDESVYYSIRGESESIIEHIERSHPIFFLRSDNSGKIIRSFMYVISLGNIIRSRSILEDRFKVGQFKELNHHSYHIQSITDLIKEVYQKITKTSKNIPTTDIEKINASFLPEIIRVTQNKYPIIYIDTHMNPLFDTDNLRNYRKNLSQFLTSKNVTYIDLNNRDELNNSELFADNAHYNAKGYKNWNESTNISGIPLNSRIIAEEIYNLKIF